jgi:GxxExxY protein
MFTSEGYQLIGAAFEVYNHLGHGMSEEVYQQSLEVELQSQGIPFVAKPQLDVFYKGIRLNVHYKPDLLVYEGIVVELKAVSQLLAEHEAQLFNYLRVSKCLVGYLINFGSRDELEWKRYILADNQVASGQSRKREH